MKLHPDFQEQPWCRDILDDPQVQFVEAPTSDVVANGIPATQGNEERVSNSMFVRTLYNASSNAIRAQINFSRPVREPDAITPDEYCYLLSIGDGLDGKTGRAHGGFNALILDQMTGTTASKVGGSFAPATARLEMDYAAPIDTPGIVLCRGWTVERSGRKTWVKAVIEDGKGRLLAKGRALFIDPKNSKL